MIQRTLKRPPFRIRTLTTPFKGVATLKRLPSAEILDVDEGLIVADGSWRCPLPLLLYLRPFHYSLFAANSFFADNRSITGSASCPFKNITASRRSSASPVISLALRSRVR